MEFNLNGMYAYVIQDTEEGCLIFDGNGFLMGTEQMKYVAKRLLETAEKLVSPKDIEDHNRAQQEELEKEMSGWYSASKEPKPGREMSVYMLECGGRYKIGISADVNRRAAELDKRPFPVKIIAVSKATTSAYKIEQALHKTLTQFRVGGEWFTMEEGLVKTVKNYIERIV